MRDCFALLKEPRRPWLEPELLKQKFLTLSSAGHPDRVHQGTESEKRAAQEQYAELNSAYQCLRNDKDRLAHFLELEAGAKPHPLQSVPAELMELSFEISRACREADALVAEKAHVGSPLLQVAFFERTQLMTEQLLARQARIRSWQDQLREELQNLDRQWSEAKAAGAVPPPMLFQRLEALCRLFGFIARWTAQLQERLTQLSF